jgi:Histidine kinase-, DNA gyrase B-, and HSP90-like ATPase
MTSYKHTSLWQSTLAARDDEHEHARERLRVAYEELRERASSLAGEIASSLPDFTIHDISHADALWDVADRIAGPEFRFTPVEAFVLGATFLVHDLGLGLAAYSGGQAELVREPLWQREVSRLLRSTTGRSPTARQIEEASLDVKARATASVLRELHAAQAERVILQSWEDPRSREAWFLIDSPELRAALGPVIGRIAHSHWWGVSRLRLEFGQRLGALPRFPPEWTFDPLSIAALLRVADAGHLDSRRAPGFLFALRQPAKEAEPHWVFQQHLLTPRVEDGQLVYTAGHLFADRDADAWWLCLEHLRVLDRELREVDALLSDTGRSRFAARGVRGVADPVRFAELVRTDGWLPVDVRVRVGDATSLVRRLGGEHLYGDSPSVAIRELIQNASDAVRARRILEDRESGWGEIRIRTGTDELGDWIEVGDTGIGMSDAVLAGPLLDFGTSYWDSSDARGEFPSLLARGFEPTGHFGIGFFSVFMAGTSVRVASRRFDAAQADTRVLEFRHGVEGRPLLRGASESERLKEGGTRVRIWLDQPFAALVAPLRRFWELRRPHKLDADILAGNPPEPVAHEEDVFALFCAWLAPTLDVDLWVEEGADRAAVRVVTASDWLGMTPAELILRIHGLKKPWSEELSSALTWADNAMRHVEKDGVAVGRACLPWLTTGAFAEHGLCAITGGGIRVALVEGIFGILTGYPHTAVRDDARPDADSVAMGLWATEQGAIANRLIDDQDALPRYAAHVASLGGDSGRLPLVKFRGAWTSAAEIRSWKMLADEYLMVEESLFDGVNIEGVPVELPDVYGNVFTLKATELNYVPARDLLEAGPERSGRRGTFELLVEALAEAWQIPVRQVVEVSDFDRRLRVIGTRDGEPVQAWTIVLRKAVA